MGAPQIQDLTAPGWEGCKEVRAPESAGAAAADANGALPAQRRSGLIPGAEIAARQGQGGFGLGAHQVRPGWGDSASGWEMLKTGLGRAAGVGVRKHRGGIRAGAGTTRKACRILGREATAGRWRVSAT